MKICPYCNPGLLSPESKPTIRIKSASSYDNSKPTIRIKGASSYNRRKKLSELGALITGHSYGRSMPVTETKGASRIQGPIEKAYKLNELGKMIRPY
jgi:hypothetical protein